MDAATAQTRLRRLTKQLAWMTPCVLAAPYAIGYLLTAHLTVNAFAAAAGGIGWMVAFLARAPVSLMMKALNPACTHVALNAVSGPLEESTRLMLLLMLKAGRDIAIESAVGWSTVEVLYYLIAGFVAIRRARANPEDPGSRQLIAAAAGASGAGVIWAVVERTGATLAHAGFALLIVFNPAFALLAACLHSTLDLCAVALARKSRVAAELFIVVFGGAVVATGLQL